VQRGQHGSRGGSAPSVVTAVVLGGLLGIFGLPRLPIQFDAPTTSEATIQAPAPVIPEPVATPQRVATPQSRATPEPTPVPVRTSSAERRQIFAERFASPLPGWPNDPDGVAWFDTAGYTLAARQPDRFVALRAPVSPPEGDVVLSARFRKAGGPPGGGYGFVVRDQGLSTLDGQNQFGRFMVLEVGDQGDIGVWHREETRWIDVVPWTRSDAVRTGGQANELTVTTRGHEVTFVVNGTQVAEVRYEGLPPRGGIGIFVGGDYNRVALEWLRIDRVEQ
jgi:hypothetical protein